MQHFATFRACNSTSEYHQSPLKTRTDYIITQYFSPSELAIASVRIWRVYREAERTKNP